MEGLPDIEEGKKSRPVGRPDLSKTDTTLRIFSELGTRKVQLGTKRGMGLLLIKKKHSRGSSHSKEKMLLYVRTK